MMGIGKGILGLILALGISTGVQAQQCEYVSNTVLCESHTYEDYRYFDDKDDYKDYIDERNESLEEYRDEREEYLKNRDENEEELREERRDALEEMREESDND